MLFVAFKDERANCSKMAASGRRLNSSSIKAIFFDLDNTLIKTRKGDRLACEKMTIVLCDEYRVPHSEAALITQAFLHNFRLCPDNCELHLDQWRSLLWANALGEQYASRAGEVYLQWLTLRYHYLALAPEVSALLAKLRRHYLVGLITNGPSSAQWEKVRRLDIQHHFDCILVSGDLPWEKPHRKIFLEACKSLCVEPESAIMVGDKLETDILGGQEARLGGTVWIPLNKDCRHLGEGDPSPDFTIDKVTDLPSLLPPGSVTVKRSTSGPLSPFMCPQNRRLRLAASPDLDDCNSNSSDGS